MRCPPEPCLRRLPLLPTRSPPPRRSAEAVIEVGPHPSLARATAQHSCTRARQQGLLKRPSGLTSSSRHSVEVRTRPATCHHHDGMMKTSVQRADPLAPAHPGDEGELKQLLDETAGTDAVQRDGQRPNQAGSQPLHLAVRCAKRLYPPLHRCLVAPTFTRASPADADHPSQSPPSNSSTSMTPQRSTCRIRAGKLRSTSQRPSIAATCSPSSSRRTTPTT